MYTAEDVRKIEFTRSMSGYKTSEVDAFIDQCADTLEMLAQQNEEQMKKLEVLAERLMEYRKDEENIHTALLSAQRAGDALLREAQHKASLIMEDAVIKADKAKELAERDIQKEKDELVRIKGEVTTFKQTMLDLYRQHLTLIDALPEEETVASEETPEEAPVEVAPEEPAPEEPVAEDPVIEVPAEPEAEPVEETSPLTDIFSSSAMETAEEPVAEGTATSEADPSESVMVAPEVGTQAMFFNEVLTEEEERPASRFKDLQFGPEYELEGDSRRRFGKRK